MKPLALVLVVLTFQFRAIAEDDRPVTGAGITEVGIFKAHVVRTNNVPAYGAGIKHDVDLPILVQSTTNIPARVGTQFGFRYFIPWTITNAPVILTLVGQHPPLKEPRSGKVLTRDEFKVNAWEYQPYFLYAFDEEWEAIPGKWKFEVWHEGTKLCEQSFTVVPDTKPNGKK